MKIEPRGRIHQDAEFTFSEFDGLKIDRLVVCRKIKTNEPIIVFIKVFKKNWQQYFLDAGIGFWEDWNLIDLKDEEEEDGDFELYDSTDTFQLANKIISKIYGQQELKNSCITIELEDKSKLILKCTNPEIFDSSCELVKID